MYCPCCKSEYREGITHCVYCDVDLLEQLPESGTVAEEFKNTKANGRLRKLLTVDEQEEAVQENPKQSKEPMPSLSYRYIRFLTRLILGLALGSIAVIVIVKLILLII